MDAQLVDELPVGPAWQYEPRWHGFHCLAFRDGAKVDLMSNTGKPLTRYFPELVDVLRKVRAQRFVLDGVIIVRKGGEPSFDELLLRIHPTKSRIIRLAAESPAWLIVFDLLVDAKGTSLVKKPLSDRRTALETFLAEEVSVELPVKLSPATTKTATMKRWLRSGLDGIIAKNLALPYLSGTRDGMQMTKSMRSSAERDHEGRSALKLLARWRPPRPVSARLPRRWPSPDRATPAPPRHQ